MTLCFLFFLILYMCIYLDVLAEEKKRRVSKRAQKLEEKLKNRSVTSLFDTDGDLSKHNIIEGSRRTRKRTASTEEMPNKRKRPDSRVLIKNARDKLMPKPTTELDKTRNEAILQRQHELEKILDQHESKVKELYHLEMYQNMLDFDPKKNLVNDLIYQKVSSLSFFGLCLMLYTIVHTRL